MVMLFLCCFTVNATEVARKGHFQFEGQLRPAKAFNRALSAIII